MECMDFDDHLTIGSRTIGFFKYEIMVVCGVCVFAKISQNKQQSGMLKQYSVQFNRFRDYTTVAIFNNELQSAICQII